ncbi:UDP-galactofuranosyl transferase GlfT1 [Mycobacterium ulcerans str. Harvey]|uniref:UDP-galactofuranosyl transferase GlfT1 n=1 Tax=Mycobacterium ulcerans str. Harvey TaxID=1299332 RepID=A0ABP3AQH5_MYCUL|nr:UDP-galactofuranosyl transferase GlfT1 [Mycobacterium ulcerans str. Harvey]
MSDTVIAVVVTHRRPDELAKSLDVLSTQTRLPDHLIVIDNDAAEGSGANRVGDLVAGQPIPTTYLKSRRNLGGAGGFALGMLHALALGPTGCGWPTTTGAPGHRRIGDPVGMRRKVRAGRSVAGRLQHGRPAAPGLSVAAWPGVAQARQRIAHRGGPGVAGRDSLAVQRSAVPRVDAGSDRRPGPEAFHPGDEVEIHRRLVRSRLPFGTCLDTAYLHPCGSDEFKPILGGRMHTQYPDDPGKRFFTYRNRGYVLSQPGLRKLLPQEWLRFGWFFLVTRHDPKGLREWIRLRRLGRHEKFGKPDLGGSR